eukprot:TRINITY_DN2345_c0_g1_i1.p1 TRINITY_DN2345_c0_g1~~TRINITY_DN2345_c0_g1_i1.p1  ORF type:complete len:102 (-),score=2.59 TRINITY_DN2345_c0_g1_i1:14-319(-)
MKLIRSVFAVLDILAVAVKFVHVVLLMPQVVQTNLLMVVMIPVGLPLAHHVEKVIAESSAKFNHLATCSDGILNQDEIATDCGGSTCNPCPAFSWVVSPWG